MADLNKGRNSRTTSYKTRTSSKKDRTPVDLASFAKKRNRYNSSISSKVGRNPVTGKDLRKEQSVNRRKKQQLQLKIGVVALLVIILFSTVHMLTRKNAINVYLGEQYIAMIENKKITSEDFTNSVTAQLTSEVGANILLDDEIIFEPIHGKKKEIVVPEHALTLIKQVATYKVEGAVITVDGGDYLALVNEEEAQQVLDELIAEYVPEGANIVEKGFVENVTVSLKFVVSSAIISMEEAKKRFEEGTQITRTYTVASGDSIYKIASINGVTVEDLLSTNPELTMNSTLRVGDQLKVNGMEPFLSVKTAENVVFTEKQEKEIQYQQDNTRPTSYKRVVQQGKDGQKEVVTQIIRVNGFETEQRVISETTTVEPVPEIIVVGTL